MPQLSGPCDTVPVAGAVSETVTRLPMLGVPVSEPVMLAGTPGAPVPIAVAVPLRPGIVIVADCPGKRPSKVPVIV